MQAISAAARAMNLPPDFKNLRTLDKVGYLTYVDGGLRSRCETRSGCWEALECSHVTINRAPTTTPPGVGTEATAFPPLSGADRPAASTSEFNTGWKETPAKGPLCMAKARTTPPIDPLDAATTSVAPATATMNPGEIGAGDNPAEPARDPGANRRAQSSART